MMELFEPLFRSGRIVDLILVLLVMEVLVLFVVRRTTGAGPAALDMLMNNLAGAALLMALRAALTGAAWTAIAPWLIASLVAHLADLTRRWNGSGGSLASPRVR